MRRDTVKGNEMRSDEIRWDKMGQNEIKRKRKMNDIKSKKEKRDNHSMLGRPLLTSYLIMSQA